MIVPKKNNCLIEIDYKSCKTLLISKHYFLQLTISNIDIKWQIICNLDIVVCSGLIGEPIFIKF
jgi:hypothetical protein